MSSRDWDPGEAIGKLFNDDRPPAEPAWLEAMTEAYEDADRPLIDAQADAQADDSADQREDSGQETSANSWLLRAQALAQAAAAETEDVASAHTPADAVGPKTEDDVSWSEPVWDGDNEAEIDDDELTALLGEVVEPAAAEPGSDQELDLLGAVEPAAAEDPTSGPLPGAAPPSRRAANDATRHDVASWMARSETIQRRVTPEPDDEDDDLEGLFSDAPVRGGRAELIGLLDEQLGQMRQEEEDDDLYHDGAVDPELRQRVGDMVRRVAGQLSQEPAVTDLLRTFTLTRDETVDSAQLSALDTYIRQAIVRLNLPVTGEEADLLVRLTYDEIIGLGPLGGPWRDNTVTEIMVDGWDRIVVEQNGRLRTTDLSFNSKEHANDLARRLARLVSDRTPSQTNTLVTAQLDQARVHFAYGPVTATGLYVNLRKQFRLLGMDSLLERGSLSEEMAEFLHEAVASRATTLVSGGTGVGKTTFINALSESIPDSERVVTIEDSFELQLANRHVVSLQTKERASADDTNIVDQDMLLVSALRMRPDRIIVGEIREPKAAFTMLAAANTGHDGTMTTIHANSATSAINSRLANLVRVGGGVPDDVAKREIVEAFDLVVQVSRQAGRRYISAIATVDRIVDGSIAPNVIFTGMLAADGTTQFTQVGHLDPADGLARKMREAGWQPERWTAVNQPNGW